MNEKIIFKWDKKVNKGLVEKYIKKKWVYKI